jgi:O-antigen/teichoic acid export membrane protein
VAFWFLRKLNWKETRQKKVNWHWIMGGVKNSLLFLGATLAMRGMEFADRFFIEFYHGKTLLGIYSFHASIANIVLIFLQTGVLAIYHPLLIRSFQNQDYLTYKKTFYRMIIFTLLSMVSLSFLSGIGILGILWFIEKPIYDDYLNIFFLLLLNTNIMALSLLTQYSLYVRRQDRGILVSRIAAFAVVLLLNSLFVPEWHLYGAAFSTLIAMFILMTLNYLLLRHCKKENFFP